MALVGKEGVGELLEESLDIDHRHVSVLRPVDQGGVVLGNRSTPGCALAESFGRKFVGTREDRDGNAAIPGLSTEALEISQIILDTDSGMVRTHIGHGRLSAPSARIVHQHQVCTITNECTLAHYQRPGRDSKGLVRFADGFGRIVPAERNQQQIRVIFIDFLKEAHQALVRGVARDAGIDDFESSGGNGRLLVQQGLEPARPSPVWWSVGQRIAITHDADDVRRLRVFRQRTLESLRVERLVGGWPPQEDRVGLAVLVAGNRRQPPVVMTRSPDRLDPLMVLQDTEVCEYPAGHFNHAEGND